MMNQPIPEILLILQILLLIPTGLAVLYIFTFAFAGVFYRQPSFPDEVPVRKFAVMIPGYKEDAVILEVAREALRQDYPRSWYDVIIIADSFQKQTLAELKKLPVRVVEVSFDKSTKARALNRAMQLMDEPYDIALILDADNIMARDFLKKVNAAFEGSYIAVQGHRTAKNLDAPLAVLDAISEEINNHIFRRGHRALGLSSAIIGSGMAFRYPFFREMMAGVDAVGGFDKEIELLMLKGGHVIQYLDDALVYDEKVSKSEVFHNQRRRWLSAQLIYFRKDFLSAFKALILKGNIDYFDKTIQFIQPPRILLLAVVLVTSALFIPLNAIYEPHGWLLRAWIAVVVMCLAAFLFSVPRTFYNRRTLRALLWLPSGMILMMKSLLRIKGANKQFIHTQHGAAGTKSKIH